ncbi:MAG TPA: DegV family protein [Bacillota bacterium]|nr:DegV family protein [Bacillota bacterium]
MSVRILVDSTCDLPLNLQKKWDIGVAPLFVQLGKESYLDRIDLNIDDFYRWCRTHTELPKTAQPSVGNCEKLIRESLEHYDEVICLTISSGLSGTAQAFRLAGEAYGNRVTVYDTLFGSLGVALMAVKAAEMSQMGLSTSDILLELQNLRSELRVYVVLDTLEYAVKGGRVSRLSYIAANMFTIKPIVHLDIDGLVKVKEKVRSEAKALRYLINVMKEKYAGTRPQRVGIAHGDCEERMYAFVQMVQDELNPIDIMISEIGPAIGTYAAPGALLVAF